MRSKEIGSLRKDVVGVAGKSPRIGFVKKEKVAVKEEKKNRREVLPDAKRACTIMPTDGHAIKLGHVENIDPKIRVVVCAKCGKEVSCEKGVEYFRYACPYCKKGNLVRKG
jgi:DNA-directed RNA polymerase subunit RPC12/RpoP